MSTERNTAALVGLDAMHRAQLHGVSAMVQQLLEVAPASERRLARIDAGVSVLQAVANLYQLFAAVMNPENTGTHVEEVAEVVDEQLNELEEKIDAYVTARRGDSTDELHECAEVMREVLFKRETARVANLKLDASVERFKQATKEAAEMGGTVGEILPTGVVIKRPRMSDLTKPDKLVS